MNKQVVFASFFIFLFLSQNIIGQQGPEENESTRKNKATPLDLERETLNAITFSEKLNPLPDKFCDNVISSAPKELGEDLKLFFDLRIRDRMLPSCIILYGPTGSGKSTLAKVIAQRMQMPYCVVRGSQVANEYINSGKSGLRRIGTLASEKKQTVIIDEFDTLAEKFEKDVDQQAVDQTCIAFWEMIDTLEENRLLFIGTTNDLRGMPEQLRSRLRGFYYEIPYQKNEDNIKSIITSSLQDTPCDCDKTLDLIIHTVEGFSTRDIKKLIYLADRHARRKNPTAPIITIDDFRVAINKLKADERIDSKTKFNKKKIFNYSVQTISALSAIAGIGIAIYSAKLATEGLKINRQNLAISEALAQFNTVATLLNTKLAETNTETAKKGLECAQKSLVIAQEAKMQSAIMGSIGLLIGGAGVLVASKAAAAGTATAAYSCSIQ